jgi:lipoprotein-anchoring transpeptidase ErfK/SrfK
MGGRRNEIWVDVPSQVLELRSGDLVRLRVPVSTSRFGTGCEPGSFRTPTGWFRIAARIGAGYPSGTWFRARRPVGRWLPSHATDGDLVLTRILWLDGLEPANANTRDRFIYLHGTNDEASIGRPASFGCIRLRNDDILRLFSLARTGDRVRIGDFGLATCPWIR